MAEPMTGWGEESDAPVVPIPRDPPPPPGYVDPLEGGALSGDAAGTNGPTEAQTSTEAVS
jgi:hypothetical protein